MQAQWNPDDAAVVRAALTCGRPGCACARGGNVHCPVHDDRNPSFSVHAGRDGRLLVHCQANCPNETVITTLRQLGVWPERGKEVAVSNVQPLERCVAIYQYVTADGELAGEKGRFEKPDGTKTFRWRTPGSETWSGGIKTSDMPLWGAELVAAAPIDEPIAYVEGEKAAAACREQNLLAVTHGGGASTKDFGDSLEVLRGRDVLLWPDNDEPGREYMARVHALLKPIARSLYVVEPPLPAKGDAHDYFAAGGTVAGLVNHVPPTKPVVDFLAHDAVRVRVPTPIGVIAVTFTEMEKTARELAAEVEVRRESAPESDPYSQRLNLLSASQRTELRRDLESLYGKGYAWPSVLNTALALARTAYLEQDRGVLAAEIHSEPEFEFTVATLVPAGAPTLFFADGSSGKSYTCIRIAVAVALGQPFAGLDTLKGGVLYVDYEDSGANWKRRLRRVYAGMGFAEEPRLPIYYWSARGIPLCDQIDAIRRKCLKDGITVVIIDAAADACGGEPEKADVALRYFNALEKLPTGTTTITIAHVTNQAARNEQAERAFGSAVWHNRPRRTWYVARIQEEESDVMDLGLYCKKTNDGRKVAPVGLRVTFDGMNGPVTVERHDVRDVPALAKRRSLKEWAYDLLRQPMTLAALAEQIVELTGRDFRTEEEQRKFRESLAATLRTNRTLFEHVDASTSFGGRSHPAVWQRREKEGA